MLSVFANKLFIYIYIYTRGVTIRIFVLTKMAPSMAAVLRAPRILCSLSYVLFVILLFYVLDVVSITVYDRHTLLNIGSSVAQCKPELHLNYPDSTSKSVRRLLKTWETSAV